MTQPMTSEQARALLRENPGAYQTAEKLRELAAQVDADASGRLTVLYSGPAAKDIWSTDVINAMVEAGEDVRVINKSEAAKFLGSREFYNAVADAYDVDVDKLVDGSYRGPASDWLYHPTQGPWADASARFADATRGEVRAIVADANPTRVFGAVEVPHVLANPNVTVVEGIPREALAGLSERSGQQAAFELIVARSREHVAELRVPANTDAIRNEKGVLRLDSRDYLAETGIDGRPPAFSEPTHKLAERMNPPTEHVQAGQARWNEWHAIGADTAPGRAGPRLGRAGAAAGLAGLGIAAAAYDAKQTGDRINTAFEQDNPVAARSEAERFLARSGGGAAAVFTPIAFGATGGPAAALLAADAYLLTEGFERLVERRELNKIVNQKVDGVDWTLTGRQWVREDLRTDLIDDGVDQSNKGRLAAPVELVPKLNYLASVEATSQSMGDAKPRNPFELPADASDQRSSMPSPWNYDAQSGRWTRIRFEEIDPTDPRLPDRAVPDVAGPERAAELNQQASAIIDRNVREGSAPLAMQFEIAYRRNGWHRFGPEPPAVLTALNPDALKASDGQQYVRNAKGQWSHDGEAARGNIGLELEATRMRLIPALEQHEANLAKIPAWQPPTPEQLDREKLRQLYTDFNVAPSQEQFEVAYAAVQRTRKAEGIDPATSSLGMAPSSDNHYYVGTPILHLRTDMDGVVRVMATTTVDVLPPKETVLNGAPAADVPSAQQREGQSQAAVNTVAPAMSGPGGRNGRADGNEREPLEDAPTKRTTYGAATDPTVPAPVPPDFAPSQQGLRDIRDPQHEGHLAYCEMAHRAALFETQNGISHGPHTERLGASMLAFAVENRFHYQEVSLEKNQETGQVRLKHAPYGEPAQYFPADLASMSSQPIEATSQRINEAVSKHNANLAPALERTQEQAQAVGAFSFEDKVMFARVRGGTPGRIPDETVAAAVVEAKRNGFDVNNISQVAMVGDHIRIARSGPDEKAVLFDVTTPVPPLQASVQEANTLNQQQVLAQHQAMVQQQSQNPQQDGQSGPTMGARSM